MKAIDFACRLLMQMEKAPLTASRQRILIAIGAGLESCADIAAHCVLSKQQTAAKLSSLEHSKHIIKDSTQKPISYYLSQEGKKYLKELFNFLPHQEH